MFRAEVNHQALQFDPSGVRGGNEVYRDRQTGSRWQQDTLTAISGPLAGTHLELFPALLTTWGEWRRLHPATVALEPMPGYAARLPQVNRQLNAGVLGLSGPAPRGAFGHDDRLAPRATVVGLEAANAAKAYPTATLRQRGVVNDEVGGAPILIVDQAASDTITAFEAMAKGRRLHFAAAGAARVRDRETGSTWDAYGRCLAGPLRGTQLREVVLVQEFWFAWSEFHPGTLLFAPAGK